MAHSALAEGISNINSIAALDEILECFFTDKDFPRPFIEDFCWDPRSLYLSKPAQLSSVWFYPLSSFTSADLLRLFAFALLIFRAAAEQA